MKIEYISNTCDVEELSEFGEIAIIFKDGILEPIEHWDYSDDAMNFGFIPSILKHWGIILEFVQIDPTYSQIQATKKYLREQGY